MTTANTSASQTNVPMVDLKAQFDSIADEVNDAVQQCVASCQYIQGPQVATFERAFASFCGVQQCVGVASGTDALHLACRAVGVGPGDEVIIPANTFVATAAGVCMAGGIPVLVDVDPNTSLIDVAQIESAITPGTKAIIAVHLYGQCANMDAVNTIAKQHGLSVIEDAAQAHGAQYRGRPAGSLGDIAAFSFYPGKNLGAYGDGGAITTNDARLAERVRMLGNYGAPRKYHHVEFGFNSRLDSLQAAVLSVKLNHLNAWNESRRRIADRYAEAWAFRSDVAITPCVDGNTHVYHLYVVRCADRDERLANLNATGVGAGLHYPAPIHLLPAYSWLDQPRGKFPNAESFAATCLSLPIYAEMTDEQIEHVIASL